ncbi:hypothetical protein O6H91_18G061400 [Diphasiastrum complanatum]|uniref:Uncharacterized protein n=1 Tax=Diphasiastrum complanatum TaxID=34168 RepID=A0ACC2B1U7_DIPCM|nr:hypothetical protein O6H91_18G061400 [Diphasiastrum complanatum]
MVFGVAAASRSIAAAAAAAASPSSMGMNAGGIDRAESNECGVKVLDMSAYYSGDPHKLKDFVTQLHVQCRTTGFFYLQNHSVPQHLCDDMLQLARKFFTSSLDTKMSIDYTQSAQFRGYMRLGWENTAGLSDYREQLDFGPEEEEEADMINGRLNHLVYPLYRRLRGPNQWLSNETIPHFRPIVENFMLKMSTFSMEVMKCIALSLGLSKDYFDSSFGHRPHYQMKVARYPPVPEPEMGGNGSLYGVGPHTDSGYLSFLLQDDVGGLQAWLSSLLHLSSMYLCC